MGSTALPGVAWRCRSRRNMAGRRGAGSVPRGGWRGWRGWPLPARSSSRWRRATPSPLYPLRGARRFRRSPRCPPRREQRVKGILQRRFTPAVAAQRAERAERRGAFRTSRLGRGLFGQPAPARAPSGGRYDARDGESWPPRARPPARTRPCGAMRLAMRPPRGSAREKGTQGVAACHRVGRAR